MRETKGSTYIAQAERRRARLEEYLQKRIGYTKKELMKLLADDLAEIRDVAEISLRTINYDLNYLESQGAVIEKFTKKITTYSGQNKTVFYYRYSNPSWSFQKKITPPHILSSVKAAVAILRQIPGIRLHQDLKEIYQSLVQYADSPLDDRPYILFDHKEGISGLKHISDILKAIINRKVIQFPYRRFGQEITSKVTLSPYLLKEFESRWYLIGFNHDKKQLRHYGLDRIMSLNISEVNNSQYITTTDFNPAEHFRNIIGVSIYGDAKPLSILIKINKSRAIHVDNAPLHHSQNFIAEDELTKSYRLTLAHNHELENLLLSYGKDLEVVEPVELRDKIKDILQETLRKYLK